MSLRGIKQMSMQKKVASWIKGQNASGANGLAILKEAIEHANGQSRDWTPLAYMLGRTQPATAKIATLIVKAALPGVVIKADDKQPAGVRLTIGKDVVLNDAAMLDLKALVDAKAPIGGRQVAAKFAPEKKEKAVKKAAEADKVDAITEEGAPELLAIEGPLGSSAALNRALGLIEALSPEDMDILMNALVEARAQTLAQAA